MCSSRVTESNPQLKNIRAGVLDIAYFEIGEREGRPAILLHGFPYDALACVESARFLAHRGMRCLVPFLRGYGPTRFVDKDTQRSGQQAAIGCDLLAFMDALEIPRAALAGYDWGGRAACIVSALWPDRVLGLVTCGEGYNIQNIARATEPAPPEEEVRYWYQYYFHTERGVAGLTRNRSEICRHIWKMWSPTWTFDEITFEATAASFANPDFVDIVIHSYRHRSGAAEGDPQLEHVEAELALQPHVTVPTILLQGSDDGVDPPSEQDHAQQYFEGPYERRILPGVGHNLPQEAPQAFADAVQQLANELS